MYGVVLAILLYVCLGLGITRIKIANSHRLRKRWFQAHPISQLVAVLIEPMMALYRGWEVVVLVLFAAFVGGKLEMESDEDEEANDQPGA